MNAIKTAFINAIGDTYENMPIREVMRGSDAILSALDKAGYAVVPVEPTLKMNEAGYSAKSVGCWVPDIYKAMLTAAKETP